MSDLEHFIQLGVERQKCAQSIGKKDCWACKGDNLCSCEEWKKFTLAARLRKLFGSMKQ